MDADVVINYLVIGIFLIIPVGIVIGIAISGYNLKRWIYDFLHIDYKIIEKHHDGKLQKTFIVPDKEIKDNVWTDKDGKIYYLTPIASPHRINSYGIRYVFYNDNIFPVVNERINTGENSLVSNKSYEVLSKTKDGKYFIISNLWIKSMLNTHFVEKIKAEATNNWEKIFDFLKSPSGFALIVMGIGGFVYMTMLNK